VDGITDVGTFESVGSTPEIDTSKYVKFRVFWDVAPCSQVAVD
jgi:hypothetical protein